MRLARLGLCLDRRQQDADVDGLPRLHEDLLQPPGGRRRHLGLDLVGRDLDEDLVVLDPVARALAPLGDRALGNRHAHLRHGHLCERLSS
jgi:hypothetical protein